MNAPNEFEPELTAPKIAKTNVCTRICRSGPKSGIAANGLIQGYVESRGPSPNRGASVPDYVAIGPESESQESWRKANDIDKTKQIKIVKLAHMRYQHPDLQQITTFLRGKPPAFPRLVSESCLSARQLI
jgi:hypothetical protein